MKIINKTNGYTLLELMITITVVGIIAALAIPAYQDYVTRSQVAEGIALFDGKRIQAEDMLALKGANPFQEELDVEEVEVVLNSEYVQMTAEGFQDNTYMVAFLYGNKSNKPIKNKTLLFYHTQNETGNIIWECQTNIEAKYLPDGYNCQYEHNEYDPDYPGDNDINSQNCSPTVLPPSDAMPPILGYEITYIPSDNGYVYSKNLNDGKFIYYYDNGYYIDNNGIKVNYDTNKNTISNISSNDQFYINSDGSFNMYHPNYFDIGKDINAYKKALEYQETYKDKIVPSWLQSDYDKAMAGLADGSLKNKANNFFTQFEKDYMKNGNISPNTPKVLEEIYKGIDRDNMNFREPSTLLSLSSHPELMDNLSLLNDSPNFGAFRCGGAW